ncbi:MAG: 5-(carboxyamino)imidazole ribonucleotide mutase [Planctomycetota bacterium]
MPLVAIVLGSDSDLPHFDDAFAMLGRFRVAYQTRILSAHRCPDEAGDFARSAAQAGIKVIIAAAGGAAHLAGSIAARTTLPVIGVPVPAPPLQGIDSLLATVQMPAGIPVATVAIGKAGATNAALLAIEILALADAQLADALQAYREELRTRTLGKDQLVQNQH